MITIEPPKPKRRSRRPRRKPAFPPIQRHLKSWWNAASSWLGRHRQNQPPTQTTPLSRRLAGLPQSQNPTDSPLQLRWQQLNQQLRPVGFRNSSPFRTIQLLVLLFASTSFLVAVFFYLSDTNQRQEAANRTAQYEAWQVINTAQGNTGNGGRIQALQDLNQERLSLSGLVAEQAYLAEINLQKADLRGASLRESNLRFAKLQAANLSEVNLEGANLSYADLQGANLSEADLAGANLLFTDFRNVKNLTPEQVKRAKNWRKAIFEDDFRQKLGQ